MACPLPDSDSSSPLIWNQLRRQ